MPEKTQSVRRREVKIERAKGKAAFVIVSSVHCSGFCEKMLADKFRLKRLFVDVQINMDAA